MPLPGFSWHGPDVERRVVDRPEYEKHPLVEAIFELFADSEAGSAWTVDSLPRLIAGFPEHGFHEEQIRDFGLGIQVGPKGAIRRTTQLPRERVRRWDSRRLEAIQFGAHMCAFNVLGEAYKHCTDHLPMVERVVRSYLDTVKPAQLAWIGQRYINVIKIPLTETDVAAYFEIYPRLPRGLTGHRPIGIQLQMVEVKNAEVTANLALQSTDTEHATYMLDIYARSVGAVPNDAEAILRWHNETHHAVSETFEMSISDKSRDNLFKRKR